MYTSKILKVTIVGATGKTGKSLALTLKQSSIIDELAVYDTNPIAGLLLELSHIDSRCKTICCNMESDKRRLEHALTGAKVVVITLEYQYLYEEAHFLKMLIPQIVNYCPQALVALVSRSTNCLLPMMFELYKKLGIYEHGRLFGITNLYSIRANNCASKTIGISPEFISVPLIGGCSTKTCIPVFSHTRPCANFSFEETLGMTQIMQTADYRLAQAYNDTSTNIVESSSVCTGFAAARFCISLCKAVRSESGIFEYAYVRCCLIPELKYMTTLMELGPHGLQKYMGLPELTNQECTSLFRVIPEIRKSIALGESGVGDAISGRYIGVGRIARNDTVNSDKSKWQARCGGGESER
ncbi:PREDICTED: malate dehydrogenase, mitochondrial-like [Ceratosolen solmsi marchali]|uniref:Malate dehydrogenase, mitochondrial n=1 Tax=Ceratosolen solmsi marchali TaxID=326594 RepID=A0AAJ7DYC8_9HYME|nr:PREDICTED: malate dehydrogenase, mitochondrial-like [Ceratosolen solmsi marchali]